MTAPQGVTKGSEATDKKSCGMHWPDRNPWFRVLAFTAFRRIVCYFREDIMD
jgi:hypothetical protein